MYYFSVLSGVCNIFLPRSLANGVNKSLKPVPSFLPFPICNEWSQFSWSLPFLGSQCPLPHSRAVLVTAFLCNMNGQITLVTNAETASCASAAGKCPPRWSMGHKIPAWASPIGSHHVNLHPSVAALHQPNTASVGPSAQALEMWLAWVTSCLSAPGCTSAPTSWAEPGSGPHSEALQPGTGLASLPAAGIPLPIPPLTGLEICPQECCHICLA